MQPSIKKLSELEKEQILQESYEPSCVIADLAKHHGIPSRVIYDLRCKKKAASVVEIPTNYASDFVELSVNTSPKKAASLKRAVLEFNNLSISIDGNIKSSTLVQMLNILEESC
jgi:transposase-like protein|tara:strand:+ start:83 stop:424 length:342 start_codon:yes stop_codon:yes gene_type:complete